MEQALKQRLVGAAVIIALGIILIPIVLDRAGERQLRKIPDAPRPGLQARPGFVEQQDIALPSTEHNGQIVLTLPPAQSDPSPSEQAIAADTRVAIKDAVKKKAQSPAPTSRKPEASKPLAAKKPAVKKAETRQAETAPAVVKKPQAPVVSASKKKQPSAVWVVQVGSFTDSKKAFRLRDQLLKKKYKAFVEKIKGRSGQSLYRVRVGPLPEKEQAGALALKLKQLGFKGYVTRHP